MTIFGSLFLSLSQQHLAKREQHEKRAVVEIEVTTTKQCTARNFVQMKKREKRVGKRGFSPVKKKKEKWSEKSGGGLLPLARRGNLIMTPFSRSLPFFLWEFDGEKEGTGSATSVCELCVGQQSCLYLDVFKLIAVFQIDSLDKLIRMEGVCGKNIK